MRSVILVALLGVAGCGVAPTGEDVAGLAGVCGTNIPISGSLEIWTSTTNPWGGHPGVVTVYPNGDGTYWAFGSDPDTSHTYWFMRAATKADIDRFEAYPQSQRNCDGNATGGGGSSPKGTPDPQFDGVCAPSTLYADAGWEYLFGPLVDPWTDYCALDGAGCVLLSCWDYSPSCGSHPNGCGGTLSCGSCTGHCPCGGVWPNRCLVCRF